MPIKINDLQNRQVADLLKRLDRSNIGDGDGKLSNTEATAAAQKIATSNHWNQAAINTFGVAPQSGAELRRFVEQSPKEEALERILNTNVIAGLSSMGASGRGTRGHLGEIARGHSSSAQQRDISITPGGRISVDGLVPKDLRSLSHGIYDAAQLVDQLPEANLSETTQKRLFSNLSDALTVSQTGRRTRARERMFAGSMTMMIGLAKSADSADAKELQKSVIDRSLQALSQEKDPEMRMFYMNAMGELKADMDPVQQAALHNIEQSLMPKAPPVEDYTAGRTKPMEVRHTIHEEFWKDEVKFYESSDNWKLIKKDRNDHKRVYEGTFPDPTGEKKPMTFRVEVQQGELDFLQGMSDPDVHTVIYSGHSSLGGNGSQAVHDADEAQGLPKTVLIANCRGRDNYAEFTNKFPESMLITTEDATYGPAGELRVSALFDTMIRGETFEYMRSQSDEPCWDEKADNYFYPDEKRRFRHMDADADGKTDLSAVGRDILFNVDNRGQKSDFTRAIAFVNTELHYHYELAHEAGEEYTYGRDYEDHVVAGGAIRDPQPGETIRLNKQVRANEHGEDETFFEIQFNPQALQENRDLYAGQATAHTMMELAHDKFGELSGFEAARATIMGAQAIHYLDVYTDTAQQTMRDYLDSMGLESVSVEDLNHIFTEFDSHANDPQVEAFVDLLQNKYDISLDQIKTPNRPIN